ncbi:MAG: prepilin peptidase [Bdellovibrionales bacterium]
MQNIDIALIVLAAASLTMLFIMWSDIRQFRIPNIATALLLILGIIFGFVTNNFDWLSHASAALILFIICFALFHYGLLGGGDTKLIPVVGFWVGFAYLLPFLLIMTGAGAVLGIVVAVFSAIRTRKLSADAENKTAWRKKAMPYGVAIGFASLVFFIKTAYELLGL